MVAVKRLHIKSQAKDRELNVLQHLRKKSQNNPHLISLIAAYELEDYLCLIFPWAEIDLDQYWRRQSPDGTMERSLWIREQCCGIAGALSYMHRYHTTSATSLPYDTNFTASESVQSLHCHSGSEPELGERNDITLYGRHGDIKPANILWFNTTSQKGYGTLKIADFGTARFSDDKERTVQNKFTVSHSEAYQSPESRLPGGKISIQCDVWALGCVFLEFLCWYFGGPELLVEFESQRKHDSADRSSSFFTTQGRPALLSSAELKQSVKEVSAT